MDISLPLKYRPRTYKDIVGQDTFVRFLRALSKKKIGRNLILWGPWGSGKTSSFRIYAKSLNCLNLTSEGDPCYNCESCRDTTSIIELDAASSSGKEDVKDLLEIAKSPPLFGKYRVIIADEAQQFSKAAWDALLKSIEEPKPFQVFLFSTTELNKVRDAIKSRCQCLEVKLLNHEDSKKHLKKICDAEGFKYEEIALDIISFISKGHPRDLLKNLEQVSFLGDITIENTRIIFNLGYLTHLLTLSNKLTNKETKSFREYLLVFEESPKVILETLRQFYLFLYYTFICKAKVEINPLFSLIPEGDQLSFWKQYEGLLEGNPLENFQKLLIKLSTIQDTSFSSLEIGLLEFHAYLHVQKFREPVVGKIQEISSFSGPKIEQSGKKGKGRQFVTMRIPPNPLVPVESLQEKKESISITPTASDKVYPHTLLQYGFKMKEIKNESDLVILEEG